MFGTDPTLNWHAEQCASNQSLDSAWSDNSVKYRVKRPKIPMETPRMAEGPDLTAFLSFFPVKKNRDGFYGSGYFRENMKEDFPVFDSRFLSVRFAFWTLGLEVTVGTLTIKYKDPGSSNRGRKTRGRTPLVKSNRSQPVSGNSDS